SLVLCTALGVAAARFMPDVYQAHGQLWLDSSFPQESGGGQMSLLNGQGWSEFFRSSRVILPVSRSLKTYIHVERPAPSPRSESDSSPDAADAGGGLFADFELRDDHPLPGRYRLELVAGDRYRLYRVTSALPGPLARLGLLREDSLVDSGELGGPVGRPVGFSWQPDPDRVRAASPVVFRVDEPRRAAHALGGRLSAEYSQETGLMTVRFRDDDPERAARTLDALVDRFIQAAHGVTSSKLDRLIATLQDRVAASKEDLHQARGALDRDVQGDPSVARSLPVTSGASGSDADGTAATADPYFQRRSEIRDFEASLDLLRRARARIDSGRRVSLARIRSMASDDWPDGLVGTLGELDSLRTRRAKLLETFTAKHPDVRAVDAEIDRIETRTLPSRIDQAIDVLAARRSRLEEQVRAERERMKRDASASIRGRQLWGAYAHADSVYSDLATRLQAAKLGRDSDLPAVEVLDRPAPPSVPYESRNRQIIVLAALGGLAMGIAGAILRDRMSDRIRDPEALRERLGLPLLGVIPDISASTTSRKGSNQTVLATFRGVRSRIEGMDDRKGGTVVVSSPGTGDGKSTVATNLAVSYANAGYRTTLADADLFRGCVHRIFGIPARPGLAECLLGEADVKDVLREVQVPGVMVVPSGRRTADGADLLGSARAREVLDELAARTDVLIVDTPPLAAGPEAAVLGEMSDKTVLVLRSEHTDLRQAEIQLGMLFAHRIPLVGAVLNAVSRSTPYYTYYVTDDYYREVEAPPAATGTAS
ncbi:MAG TPA: polysaccharide biosynthesis tyrosine autokinase, partial [Gemmatimonadota bacterium]|nr:polysaccharide biosynthesis tyrosine autokinase [Gemmatimonadota bacterium]